MSTESLHEMNIPELRHERHLTRVQLADVVETLKELNASAEAYRNHIRLIEARMARLERMERT